MISVQKETGAILRAVRYYADAMDPMGMSQVRLAGLIGMSASRVGSIERGKSAARVTEISSWQIACKAPFGIWGLMPPEPTMGQLDAKLDQILLVVVPGP